VSGFGGQESECRGAEVEQHERLVARFRFVRQLCPDFLEKNGLAPPW
jgi:hypothetical protein